MKNCTCHLKVCKKNAVVGPKIRERQAQCEKEKNSVFWGGYESLHFIKLNPSPVILKAFLKFYDIADTLSNEGMKYCSSLQLHSMSINKLWIRFAPKQFTFLSSRPNYQMNLLKRRVRGQNTVRSSKFSSLIAILRLFYFFARDFAHLPWKGISALKRFTQAFETSFFISSSVFVYKL